MPARRIAALFAAALALILGLIVVRTPPQDALAARAAKAMHRVWPQARWSRVLVERWPWPRAVFVDFDLRSPRGGRLRVARLRIDLELAPLVLRGEVRADEVWLLDARWSLPARHGAAWRDLPRLPVRRLHWVRGSIEGQGLVLRDVFADLRLGRGASRWEVRARLGGGSVRAFGVWRLGGRGQGHGKIEIDGVPLAALPWRLPMAPAGAQLRGSLAVRRLGDWDLRGELRVATQRARWAHLRARLHWSDRGALRIDEAFVHVGNGGAELTGGCVSDGRCRLELAGRGLPAGLLRPLWPAAFRPPDRIEGKVDLDGRIVRRRGWRVEGEIRPRRVAFVRGEMRFPIASAPLRLTWAPDALRLSWRADGDGRIEAQRTREGWRLTMAAEGGAWRGWLPDWLAAHGWGALAGDGRLAVRIDEAVSAGGAIRLHFAVEAGGAALRWRGWHKPAGAPLRAAGAAWLGADGWHLQIAQARAPGIALRGIDLRVRSESWALRAERLQLDRAQAEAAGVRLGEALGWRGRIVLDGPGRVRVDRQGLRALEGRWTLAGFDGGGVRLSGSFIGDGRRLRSASWRIVSEGVVAEGEGMLDLAARRGRIRLRMLGLRLDAGLDAWRARLRGWRDWDVRARIEDGRIAWDAMVATQLAGRGRWRNGALELRSLSSRWADGVLSLSRLALTPRPDRWRLDARLRLRGARLVAISRWIERLGVTPERGRLYLNLWLRGGLPGGLADWRVSGDGVVYGLRLRMLDGGRSLRARKLEVRARLDGERWRLDPLIVVQRDGEWRGSASIASDGSIRGMLHRAERRWRIGGRWDRIEITPAGGG